MTAESPQIDFDLKPGCLSILAEGVNVFSDLADLDVRADCVSFLAKGLPVKLQLPEGTRIDVESCAARFRKRRLVLSWSSPLLTSLESGTDLENKFSGTDANPFPTGVSLDACAECRESGKILFNLRASVHWGLEMLTKLEIPTDIRGLELFKAEVGFAELALYTSRCCRLGVPAALLGQLADAEETVHRSLAARAAGEEPSSAAVPTLIAAVRRVSGAVSDEVLMPCKVNPLGHTPSLGSSGVLSGTRWKLRCGSFVGPGMGTWKLSPDEAEVNAFAAFRKGVRHVDIAAEYGTESGVARAISRSQVPRADVFVTLKVAGDNAEILREQLRKSLNRWGGQYVDCLMLHRSPREERLLDEVWHVLEEEVNAGRARMLGASNITVKQLEALCKDRPPQLRPAMLQVKCSVFHQGGYFPETGQHSLWSSIRRHGIVPVGVSIYNPLHSCLSPLEEPLIASWAAGLGCDAATLLAHWARQMGVCPLLRVSPAHVHVFDTAVEMPLAIVAALSGMSCLSETKFCPAMSDILGLQRKTVARQAVRCGDHLRGKSVEIYGLESAAGQGLNGLMGELLSFDDAADRWQVSLPSVTKRIRGSNLLLREASCQMSLDDAREAAGQLLATLLSCGGVDAMLQELEKHRASLNNAFLQTVVANLELATARGYAVKQQVLARLLQSVRSILASRAPEPTCYVSPPPSLDITALRHGSAEAIARTHCAIAAALEGDRFIACDGFASPDDIEGLRHELEAYDDAYETAKIWIGKSAQGAQLSVPTVRSDRIFWVCGEHRTPSEEQLWDSAGTQPAAGLAPCRPEVVMSKDTSGFPCLTALMQRIDAFVMNELASRIPRLRGIAERSDAMVSIYNDGAHFQKHIDNPNKDGRVLTSIVYLNSGDPWHVRDGGMLRIHPCGGGSPADFTPECGRLVLFWADEVAHEVLPAKRRRMALTYWWFDRSKRKAALEELRKSSAPAGALPEQDEALAQNLIAAMLSEDAQPADLVRRAEALPPKALATVASIVGAEDSAQALEGMKRLSLDDLARLRGNLGKMGLK